MHRAILTFLLTFILLATGVTHSYAAFPVKDATTIIAGNEEIMAKKSFKKSRIATSFQQVKKMISSHAIGEGSSPKSGWPGITAFVCSLLALGCLTVISLVPFFFLFAILGIIFGAIGVSKKRYSSTGLALAGLILGSLEIVAAIVLIAIIISALAAIV